MTRKQLKAYLESQVNSARHNIDEWKTKLDEDPAHAMQWGAMAAFEYAAQIEVCGFTLNAISDENTDVTMDQLLQLHTDQLLHGAEYITNKSSGQGSNLLEEAKLSVHSKIVGMLTRGY